MDLIENLMEFHLTRQEATIYVALITQGKLNGYEAAKQTGISRSNTYTALASLVDKGAAYLMEGNVTSYVPIPIEEFCDNRLRHLKQVKEELLKDMPKKQEEIEGYLTIEGKEHIFNKMETMILNAKERLYISASEPILKILLPTLQDAVDRDLKVVIITSRPFQLKGATLYYTEKSEYQIGLIVDSQYVLTGDIYEENKESTCLYSKKQTLVDLFKESMRNEIKLIELTRFNY